MKQRKADKKDTEKQNQTGIKDVNDDKEEVNRLAEIWTKLGLEKNYKLKDKPKLKRKLARLLEEYQEVFSDPEYMYRKTDIMKFVVKL